MSIEIRDLTVQFKNGVTAVDHATLTIPRGIYGLLGENGAGKTTLMRVLTTVLKPTQGTASLDGLTYSKENYGKIRRKIGYLPQQIDLYPQLTVRECLEYMGELAGVEKKVLARRIDRALERTSLTAHQKKKMRQLSGGMKRRVGLVQALLHEPEFLIVDEPHHRAGSGGENTDPESAGGFFGGPDGAAVHPCGGGSGCHLQPAGGDEKGPFSVCR